MSTGEHATNDESEDADVPRRFEIPGRASVHDKRSNRGQLGDGRRFKCPWCPYTNPSERLVRLHITTEDRGRHRARNAFRDQVSVHVVDENGNHIQDIPTRKTRMSEFEGQDVIKFLPDGVDPDSRAGEIIETALRFPGKTASAIAESVYDDAEADPNPAYVRTVLKKHLGTPEMATAANNSEQSTEQEHESFSNLTDLQQGIVDAKAAYPDATNREITRMGMDTHPDYVSKLGTRFEGLIAHRRAMLEAGTIEIDDMAFDTRLEDVEPPEEIPEDEPVHRRYFWDEPEIDDLEAAVEERTDIQQRFIKEYISDPFRPMSRVEDAADVSVGYSYDTFERHGELIEALYRRFVIGEEEITNEEPDQEAAAPEESEAEPEPAGAEVPDEPPETVETTPDDHSTVTLSDSQWIEVIRLVSADAGEELLTDLVKQVD